MGLFSVCYKEEHIADLGVKFLFKPCVVFSEVSELERSYAGGGNESKLKALGCVTHLKIP
jgi:hypothetical protein